MFMLLQPLLENNFHTKAVLSVSSLVYSYCLLDRECNKQTAILSIMEKIEDKLINSCTASTDEDRYNIIIALKAIGNAGILVHLLESLSDCYKVHTSFPIFCLFLMFIKIFIIPN